MRELFLRHKDAIILFPIGVLFAYVLKVFLGIKIAAAVLFAIVAAPFCIYLGVLNWRFLSYFFFIWLLLEGVFRKWIVPDYATHAFFVKHILIAGPYIYMFTRGIKVPKSYYPFLGLIVLYLIWGIFEVINFRVTTNIKVPILGFIVHFYFIPLIFLVPMLLDSQEKILKFIKMVPYISIPIFMLGVVQYFSPHSSVINRYVDKDMPVAAIGEFVRITGVFSYISPYTTYLVGSLMLILYLVIVIRGINKRDILVIYIALALGIVNIIMTGSRGAVIGFLIQAVPFLVLSLRGKIRLRKKIIFRFMLALPLLIVFLVFTDKGSKALDAFVERTKNVHYDVIPRIIDNYTPFKFLPEAGLIGYGIGTAYQGATNLVTDWKDMPRNFEEEWERIVLEIGLIGFIIVISIRVYLAFYSLKAWRKIKTYELKNLALLILLSQTTILMGLNIIFNPLQTIFYWFFIGLLIAVLRAEKNNETQRSSIPSG